MTDRDRQFADAAKVVDESLVMRVVGAIVRRAILSGSPARRLPNLRSWWHATLKGSRYMVLAATGCVTHALLLQFLPERVTPVRPLAYLMVLAFAAFATVAGFITTRSDATAIADSMAGTANARKS